MTKLTKAQRSAAAKRGWRTRRHNPRGVRMPTVEKKWKVFLRARNALARASSVYTRTGRNVEAYNEAYSAYNRAYAEYRQVGGTKIEGSRSRSGI